MKHEFVEFIPDELDDNTIYISIDYGTATHNCCCGCGNEVITPITPTDWLLIFNGETVSLHPSIGNWNFECRSHYWIKNSKVKWASEWSDTQVDFGKRMDKEKKNKYFEKSNEQLDMKMTIWKKIKNIFM